MTATDISNQLKIGDKVNGLSGLKDCGSGRCVEIRLDGRAVPYYHGIISFDGYKTRETRFSKTKEEIENWIISKTPKGHRIFSQLDSADEMRKDLKKYSSGVMNISLPDGKGTSIWWSISDKICREAWPEEICSQILYLPNGHFKPVCAQHDPYLPEHLKTNRRCISLCDAQGNRVLIRQTGKELEIWQEKYQQSALIDPVTLKVTATGKEKPDIGNLVIRVVRTHVKKTQNHLVEKITLTANQPVSWTIGNRSALAGISEKASSLSFESKPASGSTPEKTETTVTAETACETKKLTIGLESRLGDDTAEAFVSQLWQELEKTDIPNNKNELAAFLASVEHESKGGHELTEKIGYSLERWRELARKGNQKILSAGWKSTAKIPSRNLPSCRP